MNTQTQVREVLVELVHLDKDGNVKSKTTERTVIGNGNDHR